MKIERIMSKIKNERVRDDKLFTGIEFNVRGGRVVMNYIYDELSSTPIDQTDYYMPHGEDPVFISEEEMTLLTATLQEKNVHFIIRNDEFI